MSSPPNNNDDIKLDESLHSYSPNGVVKPPNGQKNRLSSMRKELYKSGKSLSLIANILMRNVARMRKNAQFIVKLD